MRIRTAEDCLIVQLKPFLQLENFCKTWSVLFKSNKFEPKKVCMNIHHENLVNKLNRLERSMVPIDQEFHI